MERIDYGKQDEWGQPAGQQSPIDLDRWLVRKVSYESQPLSVYFTGTAPVTKQPAASGDQYLGDGDLTLGKDHYTFVRCHFHDGSEHLFNGRRLDSEWHFVFEGDDGQLLVLAVLAEAGADGVDATSLFSETLPSCDLAKLLPNSSHYYQYTGSLTTPPLKGDVTWVVMVDSVAISPATQAKVHAAFPDNHREVQPVTTLVKRFE